MVLNICVLYVLSGIKEMGLGISETILLWAQLSTALMKMSVAYRGRLNRAAFKESVAAGGGAGLTW
jgi:hypothetical protein